MCFETISAGSWNRALDVENLTCLKTKVTCGFQCQFPQEKVTLQFFLRFAAVVQASMLVVLAWIRGPIRCCDGEKCGRDDCTVPSSVVTTPKFTRRRRQAPARPYFLFRGIGLPFDGHGRNAKSRSRSRRGGTLLSGREQNLCSLRSSQTPLEHHRARCFRDSDRSPPPVRHTPLSSISGRSKISVAVQKRICVKCGRGQSRKRAAYATLHTHTNGREKNTPQEQNATASSGNDRSSAKLASSASSAGSARPGAPSSAS